jgi:hypothetical protein
MKSRRFSPLTAAMLLSALTAAASSAGPLFPTPLHLVRRVSNGIAGSDSEVDEYCAGNRMVSIHGARISILDFDARQVTEIDREAGTYSIASFEEVAAARTAIGRHGATDAAWRNDPAPPDASAMFERHVFVRADTRLEVSVDRTIALSRPALEVVIGSSYPSARTPEHDALLSAASPSVSRSAAVASQSAAVYGLPLHEALKTGGRTLFVSEVLRHDDAEAPAEALRIGRGMRRVESNLVRLARDLGDLDRLPATGARR